MSNKACVVGYPVKHSLSPLIHNAGYKALGLDWEYSTTEIEPGKFDQGIRALIEEGFKGANITMPFKSEAFEISDWASALAKKLESVNTLIFEDGLIHGYNTDAEGFVMSLVENNIEIPDLKVMVIGAGGASKAICTALVERGAQVSVTARDINKASDVVSIAQDNAGGSIQALEFDKRNEVLDSHELIVNATPIGMTLDEESTDTPIDTSKLNPLQIIVDTIYHPLQTQLLKDAKGMGCEVFNGLEMLLYQAVLAFNLMTKNEAPINEMRKALHQALR